MDERVWRRAGFWRRTGAIVVDFLVILLPLQILVALAFAATDGAVQGNFGVVTRSCTALSVTPEALARLQPPAPEGANVAVRCDVGLFGWPTSRTLSVMRQETKSGPGGGQATTTVGVGYSLNASGDVIAATNLDLPALLLLVVAVVAQWAWRGRTVGGWLLGLRLLAVRAPETRPLGWWTALLRFALCVLTQCGFLLPGLTWSLWLLNRGPDVFVARFWGWPAGLVLVGLALQLMMQVWLLIDIVRRHDPLYDRWAGTAVVVG